MGVPMLLGEPSLFSCTGRLRPMSKRRHHPPPRCYEIPTVIDRSGGLLDRTNVKGWYINSSMHCEP